MLSKMPVPVDPQADRMARVLENIMTSSPTSSASSSPSSTIRTTIATRRLGGIRTTVTESRVFTKSIDEKDEKKGSSVVSRRSKEHDHVVDSEVENLTFTTDRRATALGYPGRTATSVADEVTPANNVMPMGRRGIHVTASDELEKMRNIGATALQGTIAQNKQRVPGQLELDAVSNVSTVDEVGLSDDSSPSNWSQYPTSEVEDFDSVSVTRSPMGRGSNLSARAGNIHRQMRNIRRNSGAGSFSENESEDSEDDDDDVATDMKNRLADGLRQTMRQRGGNNGVDFQKIPQMDERTTSTAEKLYKDWQKYSRKNQSWLHYLAENLLTNMAFLKASLVLGGMDPLLALGAAPPPTKPPPAAVGDKKAGAQNGQNGSAVSLYQPQKEEEQFMELIFPGFQENTFIWNITLFQIFWFGVTMMVGHNKANPTPCALYMLGASWGPAIARGQLWRLACPMLLHANMMHLFFNVFFQLRIGFGMEKQFGKSKMRILYLACGVIGNLISVMLDPFKLAVGASTAGFGLIGVWIAEIVMSWQLLGANRDRTLIWILFMLVSVTTMSGMTPNMDLYGHFGGAFGGFLMAIIMADMREDQRPPWYALAKKLAMSAFVLLLAAGFGKIFLLTPITPLPDCKAAMLGLLASVGLPSTVLGTLGLQ